MPSSPHEEGGLAADLRLLRKIHRNLCILSEDYGDVMAGTYLDDAAAMVSTAIDRLAIYGRSLATTKPPNHQTT